MGGPSGGSSGGSGPAGKTKKGTYGTTKDAKKTSRRNEFSSAAKKVGNFIKKGGVTGAIIGAFKEGARKSKANVMDYEGQAAGVTPMRAPRDPRTGRDNDRPKIATVTNKKSIEQPKVKSQMNNTDVKSDMITAEAPAITEMSADEIALKNKRKGRKKTILTSVTGVEDYATLGKKTLLG